MVASCATLISRMNSCTSSLERGSRPVVGSSSSNSTGRRQQRARQGHLLLHAARQVLHGFVASLHWKSDPVEDHGYLHAGLRGRYAVEACRVAEVLDRRHLLEEGRLDRDSVCLLYTS